MRGGLAEALKEHAEKKLPTARLFNMPNKFRMLDALKADLAAAGVHPKTAQTLARHSTITLTMDRYTHTLRGAAEAALNSLPDYATPQAASAKRTGTDDGSRRWWERSPQIVCKCVCGIDRQNYGGGWCEDHP